jgi:hypothetical protein
MKRAFLGAFVGACALATSLLGAPVDEAVSKGSGPVYANFYSIRESQTVKHHSDNQFDAVHFEERGEHNNGNSIVSHGDTAFKIPTSGDYLITYGLFAQTAPSNRASAVGLRRNDNQIITSSTTSVQANAYSSCTTIAHLQRGDFVELVNLTSTTPDLKVGIARQDQDYPAVGAYISFQKVN